MLLVAAMAATQKVLGPSRLTSGVVPHPDEGVCGVVDNAVRLTSLRVTVYDLRERYVLHIDGQRVEVIAQEQFGPIPRILSRSFQYPAEIRSDGLGSSITCHSSVARGRQPTRWEPTEEASREHSAVAGPKRTNRPTRHRDQRRPSSGESRW